MQSLLQQVEEAHEEQLRRLEQELEHMSRFSETLKNQVANLLLILLHKYYYLVET